MSQLPRKDDSPDDTSQSGWRVRAIASPFSASFVGLKFATPLTEEDAIGRRTSASGESDTIRGTPLQSICTVLARHLGREIADRTCVEAGLGETSFNVLRKYPLRSFLQLEAAAARRLAPIFGGFDQAVFVLGSAAVSLFFDSVAGRTMKILAGDEPHRMLGAVPNSYGMLVSFGRREYTRTGERTGTFAFGRELLGPVHSSGIFDAAFKSLYDLDVDIRLEQRSPVDFTFFLRW